MFKDKSYLEDALLPVTVAFILSALLFYFAPFLAALSGIPAAAAIVLQAKKKRLKEEERLAKYLGGITDGVEQATFHAITELPVAMAAFGAKGALRWRNKLCETWLPCDEELLDLEHCLPGLTRERFTEEKGEFLYTHADKTYNIFYRQPGEKDREALLLLYLTDVTLKEKVRKRFYEQRLAIAYVQFDNYNSIFKGLSDNQRENIKSETKKLIGAWVEQIGGMSRQYGEDIHFVVMHRKGLDIAINHKFDVLDNLRGIKMGNKLPVTFSFGVASDGKDVLEIGEKAQDCLDMALGRGGDQAAVAIDGDIHFFGGMTATQEKNTRVGARNAAYVLRELIGNAGAVFIAGHINEDFDSLGAAVGVAKMAGIMGKPVYIVNSEQGVALAKFKEIAADYEEYKNILITDAEAAEMSEENALFVLVDHHRPMLCAAPSLLKKIKNRVVIDHHRRAEDFISEAELIYQEPAASSASELVTELLAYFADDIEYNRLEASILYAGIAVDSKNFAVQTGARTFEAAAALRLAGADPTMVRQLFREDITVVQSRTKVLSNMELLPGGVAIADALFSQECSQAIAQAADTMLNMDGVNASFAIGQTGEEATVSARSSGRVNVQLIMESLGGGGHQTVAGVRIKNAQVGELKAQIIDLVKKQMEESEAGEGDFAAR